MKLIEHAGKLSEDDSAFDVAYWSQLSTEEKFTAAWELVKDYYISKGKKHELRLCRSITTIGTQESPVRNHRRVRRHGAQRAKSNKRSAHLHVGTQLAR